MKLSTTGFYSTTSRLNINIINLSFIFAIAFFTSSNIFAAKFYLPQSFSISGGGTFCQTASTTLLSSSVTFNSGGSTCGSGGGGATNVSVTYQWYSNVIGSNVGGTPIGGATSATYSASIATAGTFYFYCVVSWADPDGLGSCTGGSMTSSNFLTVVVNASPTAAAAGPDQPNLCATSATLAGNVPANGTGTWTCITNCGGVTITTPGSPTSTVTGLTSGVATTLRWTIANAPCASSSDDVILTPNPPTAANAGPDQNICITSATLAGNAPAVGTGNWTCITNCGGVTITTPGSPTSTVTGLTLGVSTTLRWTTTNGSCTSTDDVIINASNPPSTSAAGADQTTAACVTTATLAGNTPGTGTGIWTCITNCGGVTITTPASPTSGVTGLTAGVATTFRWTITNGGCSSTDDVIITGGACGNNDLCSGAITATCNNSYSGTTVGMNTDLEDPACSAASAAGVWYLLAGTGGSVTASLCGSGYDTRIDVFSGTSCAAITTCVAGNDDFCGLQSQVTFATVIGTNYYILVNGFSTNTGAYTLNLSCCSAGVPNCATSPSPANAATGVSPCSSLSWTAATCNSPTSYDVYFGTVNPPPYAGNVTTTSYTTPLSGSTTYYWEIRPRNASGPAPSCSIWSFTTAASSNPQYNLVDDATSAAPYTCVTLTPAVNDQRGCAWDQNSTLGFASNFTYDWTVNLGGNDGGADGMAFVIQNDPLGRCKCGTTGGALGAGGITNSLIVEIDTYLNSEDRDDGMASVLCAGGPDPDHLDIWLNGNVNPETGGNFCVTNAGERVIPAAVPLMNGASSYNVENGLNHILRITWNAGTSTLTAQLYDFGVTTLYGTVSYSFNPMTVFGTNSPYFGFTGSTGGLNNQQTFCNPAVLLPIEIANIHTECNTDNVILHWSTASEVNNDYFLIESSNDGYNFEYVSAAIDGAGNSSSLLHYSWVDEERSTETKYYRLSQVDFNGTTKILNTVSAKCADLRSINIVSFSKDNEEVKLQIENNAKGNYKINITDNTGKIIETKETYLETGLNIISFNNLQLSAGIYFVTVSNSTESVSKKVALF